MGCNGHPIRRPKTHCSFVHWYFFQYHVPNSGSSYNLDPGGIKTYKAKTQLSSRHCSSNVIWTRNWLTSHYVDICTDSDKPVMVKWWEFSHQSRQWHQTTKAVIIFFNATHLKQNKGNLASLNNVTQEAINCI